MSEARRDSTSSLQRKKPPWLKLDIPAVVPAAAVAAEDPGSLPAGPGQHGLWAHPAQPAHHDPVTQPLRRQAFLRSVSMPAETAHVPSPYHEPRRPVLHRQTSITQTIRRYWPCPGCSGVRAAAGGPEAGIQAPLRVPPRPGAGQGLSCPSFLLGLVPHVTLAPPALGDRPLSPATLLCSPSTCSLLLCLPHLNALVPEQPTGALWACPHAAPLGLPCRPQGPPSAPVPLAVPAQVLAGVSV